MGGTAGSTAFRARLAVVIDLLARESEGCKVVTGTGVSAAGTRGQRGAFAE